MTGNREAKRRAASKIIIIKNADARREKEDGEYRRGSQVGVLKPAVQNIKKLALVPDCSPKMK